jgi:hypothetical protein
VAELKSLLFLSIGALIGSLLVPVLVTWFLPDDAVRGCKRVRCDGGEGQTPLITERDEYE